MTSKFLFDLTGRLAARRTGHRIAVLALAGAIGTLSLGACSTYNSLTQRIAQRITPYRITIVQGNFVSAEAAAKLQAGMSRNDVRLVLGTPLLTDMFHSDRWDYIFYFKRGSTDVVQQRVLTTYFDGDRLVRWTGAEDLPSEQELLAQIDGDRKSARSLETERKAAAAAAASAAVAASAAAAAAPVTAPAPSAAANVPAAPAADTSGGSYGLRAPAARNTSQQFTLPTPTSVATPLDAASAAT